MRKRGDSEILNSTIVFLLLNLLFFASMFYFVGRVTSDTALTEQIYAKEIAFIIDNAEPGMNIRIEVKELYDTATEHGISPGEAITINKEKNTITVKTKEKTSYTYRYFTTFKNLELGGDGRTYITITT